MIAGGAGSKTVADTLVRFGRIDVLANVAGRGEDTAFARVPAGAGAGSRALGKVSDLLFNYVPLDLELREFPAQWLDLLLPALKIPLI